MYFFSSFVIDLFCLFLNFEFYYVDSKVVKKKLKFVKIRFLFYFYILIFFPFLKKQQECKVFYSWSS
jgi:hypothetical protein